MPKRFSLPKKKARLIVATFPLLQKHFADVVAKNPNWKENKAHYDAIVGAVRKLREFDFLTQASTTQANQNIQSHRRIIRDTTKRAIDRQASKIADPLERQGYDGIYDSIERKRLALERKRRKP